jgi:hypothetical protein
MKKRQPPPKPKEPVPVKKPVVKLPNPSKPQDLSDQ